MSIDKAVNQAPMGLNDLLDDGPDIEIEIEEEPIIEEGSVEIILEAETDLDNEFDDNLAEVLESTITGSGL